MLRVRISLFRRIWLMFFPEDGAQYNNNTRQSCDAEVVGKTLGKYLGLERGNRNGLLPLSEEVRKQVRITFVYLGVATHDNGVIRPAILDLNHLAFVIVDMSGGWDIFGI